MRAIFNKRPPVIQKALLFIFLSVVLLLLDVRHTFSRLHYGLQAFVFPIEFSASLPFYLWHKTVDTFVSHRQLQRENQNLKTEVVLLKLQQQRFLTLENENKALRALLDTSPALQRQVTLANVLWVTTNRESQWILDKGAKEGVSLGTVVLDADGIVGQIIMVGPHQSRVMLIDDKQSALPVESVATGVRSILQGEGSDHPLLLGFIPKTEHLQVGDVLISSGMGGNFPRGYPVGKITAVDDRPGEQFLFIEVSPMAKLDRAHFVLLMSYEDHA